MLNLTINYAAWDWPQWTILVLLILEIITSIVYLGQPKKGTYSIGNALFNVAILLFVLVSGGFFH